MMTKIQFLSFVLITLSFFGCKPSSHTTAVVNNEYTAFSEFLNMGFLVRSIRNDEMKLFVAINKGNASNNGPYVITVDVPTKRIINTSTHLMSDTTNLNRQKIHSLVPEFLDYRVFSLSVDLDTNVYVRLKESDRPPTLICFSDMKYKTEKYNSWQHKKGNWYEKPD
jgi:hypothetical protein